MARRGEGVEAFEGLEETICPLLPKNFSPIGIFPLAQKLAFCQLRWRGTTEDIARHCEREEDEDLYVLAVDEAEGSGGV